VVKKSVIRVGLDVGCSRGVGLGAMCVPWLFGGAEPFRFMVVLVIVVDSGLIWGRVLAGWAGSVLIGWVENTRVAGEIPSRVARLSGGYCLSVAWGRVIVLPALYASIGTNGLYAPWGQVSARRGRGGSPFRMCKESM